MASDPADFNSQVIEEFRAHEGRLGGMFEGASLLLLHHTGAKSGAHRVNPLVYLSDDGRYVIVASKGDAPEHPGWYHNVKAHPDTHVEVGSDMIDVVASEAEGEERDRLFATIVAGSPQFAEYARTTRRVIQVMILTPA
jgi:deazaflavin-dependent oxidoreductase (nitroreductase family)